MSKIKNIISKINLKSMIILTLGVIVGTIVINYSVGKLTGTSLLATIQNLINNEEVEVKKIIIKSDGYTNKEPGSWQVEKSAEWTGAGKVMITFDINTVKKIENNNRDIILVMDISSSMYGSKLAKAKADAIELIDVVLSNDNNQVALITFDSTSRIASGFTNDKEDIKNRINALTAAERTNYNQALQSVDSVMKNYIKDDNKDLVVLFLTDGYPCEETPNQIGTYEMLKEKYPYMTINGIQYEMGTTLINEIKEISDHQWIADQQNLGNVLFEAALNPDFYDKYEIVDYIDKDYFILDKNKNIEVSVGTVKVEEENGYEKIIWTIYSFMSGKAATMNIPLVLKDTSLTEGKFYPTNASEEIISKLPDEKEEHVKSDETPVLKNGYAVIYDANNPTDCNLENIPKKVYLAYDNVTINQDKLSCKGYIFKGWEIVDDVARKLNDDVFIMPEHDVTIRATWSKPTIEKSMEGTVKEDPTLYRVVEKEASKENGQAKKYNGKVEDTFETNANSEVYYYTGNNVENNNVLFGEYCWKIVRTTTTGGVKLLYNGKPEAGKCTATGRFATITQNDLSYNESYNSPAYVGYMYNKVYEWKRHSSYTGIVFGNDVNYENGNYTLTNGTITNTRPDSTHHYSCGSSATTCKTVRYYFLYNTSEIYYIELNGATNIEEALKQMLSAPNVNESDSDIKKVIDDWYKNNLEKYKDSLEDTIFCNDRSISELAGWEPNGGAISNDELKFKEYNMTTNLTCTNDTDKFSTKNPVAELKYPIGLLTAPEANLMGPSARNIGFGYWLGTPHSAHGNQYIWVVESDGSFWNSFVNYWYGARPAISLKPGTLYSDGDGTKDNPFIIITN